MILNAYSRGDQFRNLNDAILSMIFIDDKTVILQDQDDKRQTFDTASFEKKLAKQQLIPKIPENLHADLTDYQIQTRDIRLKYMEVMLEICEADANIKPTTLECYERTIALVIQRHPDLFEHPARTTLCKLFKVWSSAQFDADVLACKKRIGHTTLSPATNALLMHYVNCEFSKSNHNIGSSHYGVYKKEAKEARKTNSDIEVASVETFRRRLGELKHVEQLLLRSNLSQAERNQLLVTLQRKIKTHYALQRVESDAVHISMSLVDDETHLPTPPITIYLSLDVNSRHPLSVVVSFGPETKEHVFNLHRHMLLADENLIAKGLPTSHIMDNGPAFNNKLTKKLLERLGEDPEFNPSNQPAKKPFVEAFFNILRTSFFKGMTIEDENGNRTVGFNSYMGKRTDKDAPKLEKIQKHADIYVSDFIRLLSIFFTEYVHKKHQTAGIVPIEAWKKSIGETEQRQHTYESVRQRFHVFSDKISTKLQKNGSVRCLKQVFFSPLLKTLHMDLVREKSKNENPLVHVYYDPYDARSVTVSVTLPGELNPIEIEAINTEHGLEEKPISFAEVNKQKLDCFVLLQDEKLQVTGEYAGKIKCFAKPLKRGSNNRSKKTQSFEQNNDLNLSTTERITQSNRGQSKLQEQITPNLTNLTNEETEDVNADTENDMPDFEDIETIEEDLEDLW